MPVQVTEVQVKNVLSRTTGFLKTVSSHSLQPYRGCTFGNSLCGKGCYVQHNSWLTAGRAWGSFLEPRMNAAEVYGQRYRAERRWARNQRGRFGIFMSSSTDPFVPQEDRYRVTEGVLRAMIKKPPDFLILQTHTHRVSMYMDLYHELAARCSLRFHISIECDRDRLPGLPPPPSSVDHRFKAAAALHGAGFRVVITASPLLPIERPRQFFERIAACADAVVLDHFVEGDGTVTGSRTRKTKLPEAMAQVDPSSVRLSYRDRMVVVAQEVMPERVGVNIDGFAGRFLPAPNVRDSG